MTFAEPRSDVHDLAPAVEKLVRAKGPQRLRDVFKRLPSSGYIHLTRGDLRTSLTRPDDLMWYTAVRNLSRNQNRAPKYRKYPPIANCALEYKDGWFILRELDDPRNALRQSLLNPVPKKVDDAEGWLFDEDRMN